MRLLIARDDSTLEVVDAPLTDDGSSKVPYAILSHRWSEDEVTYEDIRNGSYERRAGFKKVRGFIEEAQRAGFEYFWIDTLCIDKSNSTELSEAICSMFKWYKESSMCYAYLSDVSCLDNLRESSWFTRGWTLQELVAPRSLQLYSADWNYLGNKTSLIETLNRVTGIPEEILAGKSPSTASIAQRMSWAATRQTTRAEDRAYCLMGLFNLQMPVLYGEGGEKAFLRLQEEIMKSSCDSTIFAWRLPAAHRYDTHGLLASSPYAFLDSRYLVPCARKDRFSSFKMTNRGIRVQSFAALSGNRTLSAALLGFKDCRTGMELGVHLLQRGKDEFVRTRLDQFVDLGTRSVKKDFFRPTWQKFYVQQQPLQSAIITRRWKAGFRNRSGLPKGRQHLAAMSSRHSAATVPTHCIDCPSRKLAHTLQVLTRFLPVK